jgi:hypothetical protein
VSFLEHQEAQVLQFPKSCSGSSLPLMWFVKHFILHGFLFSRHNASPFPGCISASLSLLQFYGMWYSKDPTPVWVHRDHQCIKVVLAIKDDHIYKQFRPLPGRLAISPQLWHLLPVFLPSL